MRRREFVQGVALFGVGIGLAACGPQAAPADKAQPQVAASKVTPEPAYLAVARGARLTLEQKRVTVLGKAYVNHMLCIPWSGRGECIVCEEMCPLPQKAIIIQERPATDSRGRQRLLKAPVVVHERCIGCGVCESKCRVHGEAAIRVMVDPML